MSESVSTAPSILKHQKALYKDEPDPSENKVCGKTNKQIPRPHAMCVLDTFTTKGIQSSLG